MTIWKICFQTLFQKNYMYYKLHTIIGTKLSRNIPWVVPYKVTVFRSSRIFNMAARANNMLWLAEISKIFFSETNELTEGPVVSEKKLEMWKVYRRQTTDDGRQVMAIVHMDLWSRWTNNTIMSTDRCKQQHHVYR
jgi:hypothetical protein